MKFTRTLALIAGSALFLAACNQESDQAAVSVKPNTNPLLEYVPADTAYVFADLETTPKEITDAYITRFQPALDVITKEILQFQSAYEAGEYEDDKAAKLATAVLDELGGSLSADNLANLGINLQAHHAFYATGIFPVLRIQLEDAQKFRDAIARIEATMGFEIPQKTLNGSTYWQVSEEGMPVGFYIAILDQQLALSVFPVNAEDSLLAAFLGQEMPAQSMASTNTLAILNSKKGYTGYGSGIIDMQRLADEFLMADSATRAYFGPEIVQEFPALDDVCTAEIKAMVAKAPRMTAGTTKLTANEIGMRYELEIESSLAASLAGLVSDTPVAVDGDHLLSGSLAIQVGKLRSFVLEKVTAIVTTPYECEILQELNQNATEMLTQLNVPMPPMVNNLMGARILLEDFDPTTQPPQGDGLLALHVDKPEMFVGMASMMVPGFHNLDLANQKEPVEIPAEMLHMEGIEVSALMGDNAIGASIGPGQSKGLKAFMAAKPQDSGTFFSVSYDLARQMEIQGKMAENFNYDTSKFDGSDSDGSDHEAQMHELAEAFQQSYTSMLGRSRVDMRFSGDGLMIDSYMTFK